MAAKGKLQAVTMPKLGLEMTEGMVAKWHVAEGKPLKKGGDLVDIETDKIVSTVEADGDGTLLRRVADEGDTLPVGALIAVRGEKGAKDADLDAFIKDFVPAESGFVDAAGEDDGEAAQTPAPAPEPEPEHQQDPAPATAPSPSTPALVQAEQPQPADDELAKANERANATPQAIRLANAYSVDLSELEGTDRHGRITRADVMKQAGISPEPVSGTAPPGARPDFSARNAAVVATPLAMRLANELGVDLTTIRGTDRHGRITRADVERAGRSPVTARSASARTDDLRTKAGPATGPAPFEQAAHSPMRKKIAERLVASARDVPHFTLSMDIHMTSAMALRRQLRERDGFERLSINDMIIKAVANALVAVPEANVQWADAGMKQFSRADISIAVDVPGGLVTPVLRGACGMDLASVSAEASRLIGLARDRALSGDDLQGGSFTISNLGMYGISNFTAIINPPQAGILAVGAARNRMVDIGDDDGLFAEVMTVTMSCDHRAIDGATGARFMSALKDELESPVGLLL